MAKTVDHTGRRFGRLVALHMAPSRGTNRNTWWTCRCDCGAIKDVNSSHLVAGRVVSCGCWRNQRTAARSFKHGHAARGGPIQHPGPDPKRLALFAPLIEWCERPTSMHLCSQLWRRGRVNLPAKWRVSADLERRRNAFTVGHSWSNTDVN